MKRKSLSQAKNAMRRSLADLVDSPASQTEQDRLREYFQHRCAYCGAAAPRREGHLDHAVADGGSHVGNLVLACKTCNGDEKRERGWEQFLREKTADDDAQFAVRYARIAGWMAKNPSTRPPLPSEVVDALKTAETAINAFEQAYDAVRKAMLRDRMRREEAANTESVER